MNYTEPQLDELLKKNPHLRIAGSQVTICHPEPAAKKGKGVHKPGVANKTELRYASEVLEPLKHSGQILWYEFEAITLKLAFDTRYTPDYAVMKSDGEIEFHEVKGARAIYQDDAKVKVKVAARLFPFHFKTVYPRTKKQGFGWDTEIVKN